MTAIPSRQSLTESWRSKGGDLLICPPGAVRVLLATAVLIWHMSAYDIGRLGVVMFFFLSGYWTSRIWTEKFEEKQFMRFYLARALRIYPLFLVVSIGTGLIRGIPLSIENILLFGIASTEHDPTGVSWSLDIEMQYYLLCPLLLPALRRLPLITFVAVLLCCGLGWGLLPQVAVKTAFLYLPAFLAGAWADQTRWVPRLRTAILSLLAFLMTTAATWFTPFFIKRDVYPFDHDIYAFIWMLPLIPYLLRSLGGKSSRFDRKFGEYSYALYLVHYAVIAMVVVHGSAQEKLTAALLAYGIAAVLFKLVDDPINGLRYRLVEMFSGKQSG